MKPFSEIRFSPNYAYDRPGSDSLRTVIDTDSFCSSNQLLWDSCFETHCIISPNAFKMKFHALTCQRCPELHARKCTLKGLDRVYGQMGAVFLFSFFYLIHGVTCIMRYCRIYVITRVHNMGFIALDKHWTILVMEFWYIKVILLRGISLLAFKKSSSAVVNEWLYCMSSIVCTPHA